jgi:hypothetical protein
LVQKLASPWIRENWKIRTPTVLKNWKDSLPAPLAVGIFSEGTIVLIEGACQQDFAMESWLTKIPNPLKAVCYKYLELTGELGKHGSWHQGIKAVKEVGPHSMERLSAFAQQLYEFAAEINAGDFECCDKWEGRRFVGLKTCDLLPSNFGGDL